MLDCDIVVDGYIKKVLYPKAISMITPGDFAIFVLSISDIVSGSVSDKVKTGEWYTDGEITLKGSVPELNGATKYRVGADLFEDKKYGWGYQIKIMNVKADLDSEDGIRKFFSYILSPTQIDAIMSSFENPIEILETHDIDALCTIKGIGPKCAEKILLKYDNSKDNSSAYSVLYDYGLTKLMIDKLILQYKSPQTLIDRVKANPYVLIDECDGIGWVKADAMALRYGIPHDSEFRIMAYIKYYFKTLAETEGHTWVPLDALVANIEGLVPEYSKDKVANLLKQMISDGTLYYKKETKQIGLKRYRVLEENICKELLRIKGASSENLEYIEETISECEDQVGFEYTDEQKDVIRKICSSNVSLLTANAGCVDYDTEFFTGSGWKKIGEYTPGDKVLQYNKDGTASLTEPLLYIKKPCENLYHFETKYGINQTISEEHTVVYWTDDDIKKTCCVDEIIKKQNSAGCGFKGRFKTSFRYDGPGINLTDAQIKVMCAVICDGSFISGLKDKPKSKAYLKCRFHIKKERKKEELRKIFAEAQISWREFNSLATGYTDFYILAPRRDKTFGEFWYGCNNHQLKVICTNIMFWDGSVSLSKNGSITRRFSTSRKETADFVQFAYSACGYRATIKSNDRSGREYLTCGKIYKRKSVDYTVHVTDRNMIGLCSDSRPDHQKTKIESVKTKDGFKYCFMVESTMLVLRRNGCVFVTGNSGKTSLMYPVTRIFRKNGISFCQCALSGKASLNLSQLTYEDGRTIHRLLGWQPGYGFAFNKDNKLPFGAIILDEVSMVGGELFLKLVEAIENGSRLIMIGDPGQLESIGLCNLISDIKASGTIQHCYLSKIFRQAARSGIITDSIKVYNQQAILPRGFYGHVVHGELQDFDISVFEESEPCLEAAVGRYKDLVVEQGVSPEDILIVTAKRCKGILSAVEINKRAQAILGVNGKCLSRTYTDSGIEYTVDYHVGDRVIVTQNDYNAVKKCGGSTEVFNGNIGTVEEITPKNELVVKFDFDEIVFSRPKLSQLQLGYAITCAKSQGSGFPYVIAICDQSSSIMLTKEFLYTAITRAKKMCYLIGTSYSINKCIQTTRVIRKQTWLCGLLSGTDPLDEDN